MHGTLSSHRLLSTATHRRGVVYGETNGTPLCYRILVDCAIRDGAIVDEWLVRDQGAIVRQLGLEPKTYAAALIEREGGPERCVRPLTPAADIVGPYLGRGNGVGLGLRYASPLERMMRDEMSAVPETYDRACPFELPGGVTAHGRHDGFGAFDAPTGAKVYVLGIGHAEFEPRGLRREWVMIDETAVWKQILLHTGG